ncbi:MAG: efflux RND transporter periplasmic adaptor subunit [Burkholderiales bacterium]
MDRFASVPTESALGADDRGKSLWDRASWEAFAAASTSDQFCHAWLALVCSQIPAARAGAILVPSTEAHTFVPIAAWPQAAPNLARLAGVVERALREGREIVQPGSAEEPGVTHLAYPVLVDKKVAGVVALDVACGQDEIPAALRNLHWGSGWLANMFGRRELDAALQARERIGTVLEAVAVALRHGKFRQAVFEVASELRQILACAHVAIGLVENASVRVIALSEAATFEKRTPLVKAYAAAMEEAYDRGGPVSGDAAGGAGSADEAVAAAPRHRELLAQSGATHALSYPLMQGAQCMGVVTLERSGEQGFGAEDLLWLDAFAALATPVFAQRLAAERNSAVRLMREIKWLADKLFGPRNLTWKAAAVAVALAAAALALTPIAYRVSAKTVIEGEMQRVAAAPFEGFVAAEHARAGDTVKKGQLLARLDDRDLVIEQARWTNERDQYDNRLREAMATHDLTAVQVIGAQLRQAEAQLALATEKIARARIVAPYDGIVVSGDLSQQIGSPVEAGKKLFEIAPLESYRVILQVDEREIRHVRNGQQGQLVITGIAGDPLLLAVAKVTPVATAQDGRNFFRVEAKLAEAPERLRPGMEGVGKIEVGSRSLWWVLTHSFTEWLTLTLWTWLP